jgi:lipoprotein-anchoring transpeptidase ErfK/SrfK
VAFFSVAALSAAASTPQLEAEAEWVATAVSPDKSPTIAVPRLGNPLAEVTLYKVTRDASGRQTQELVPARLVTIGETEGIAGWTRMQLVKADGASPFAYDGEYRLGVTANILAPALPLPRFDTLTHEYTITTLTTPRVIVPGEVARLRFDEPVRIAWDAPLEGFSVDTTPVTGVRTWLDPADRRFGYVKLLEPAPGTRYDVHVREARGENGAPLMVPATLSVETPALPSPAVGEARLDKGRRIVLPWDNPVSSFTYEISPAVESTPVIDPANPRLTYIDLKQPKLDEQYEVTITGATSDLGAPQADGPRTFDFTTPPPLKVVKLAPRGSEIGVRREAAISIRFSEPVLDRAAAETAFSLAPAVSGRFEWLEPTVMRFLPNEVLPPETRVRVTLAAGPEGVSGESGGFFEEPYEYSFLTQPDKLIVVNLSSQRLTLFEGGQAVWSTPVATGVYRAETPTGQFLVTHKWSTLRMRGTNPSGISYDIPNVPWVMSFLGDYTIHGAPWRNQFGFPQSNGCVSMSTAASKYLYDRTPLGTPVRIYY